MYVAYTRSSFSTTSKYKNFRVEKLG